MHKEPQVSQCTSLILWGWAKVAKPGFLCLKGCVLKGPQEWTGHMISDSAYLNLAPKNLLVALLSDLSQAHDKAHKKFAV